MVATIVVKETPVNEDVAMMPMQDEVTFDLHLKSDTPYVVHFEPPKIFSEEYAVLKKGVNLFKKIKSGETTFCLYKTAQIADVQARTVAPCTGPMPIPPRPSGK